MTKLNSWDVSYSTIKFFENGLTSHKKVAKFERTKDILFKIARMDGFPPINALLINIYTVGLADMFRAKQEFPELDCIVTSANWNGYTREAKEHAVNSQIGLFVVGEFFGALWARVPYRYIQKDDDGNPIYHYKVA